MRRRLLALIGLACLGAGCALVGLGGPRALLREAESALAQRDLETGYAHLKQIRVDHPDSPESREAFPLAAESWKRLYHRDRYTNPGSGWVTAEPAFLFDWLLSQLWDDSPEQAASHLFVGCPYGVFRDFEAYARTRPDAARWRLHAEDDNGIILRVRAERVQARPLGARGSAFGQALARDAQLEALVQLRVGADLALGGEQQPRAAGVEDPQVEIPARLERGP